MSGLNEVHFAHGYATSALHEMQTIIDKMEPDDLILEFRKLLIVAEAIRLPVKSMGQLYSGFREWF